jgi:uncharacterized membrane protein YeiH
VIRKIVLGFIAATVQRTSWHVVVYGAAVQLVLRDLQAGAAMRVWVPLLCVVVVRALAVRFSLHLPRIKRGG